MQPLMLAKQARVHPVVLSCVMVFSGSSALAFSRGSTAFLRSELAIGLGLLEPNGGQLR